MSSDFPNAAWLVLELELLQPALYAGETLGQRTIHPQDIRGSAWFDGREGRGQEIGFTTGNGGARIYARSFKGNIRLIAGPQLKEF